MPFPQNDGGAYSIYHSSLSLLSQQVELKILAMNLLKSGGEIAHGLNDFGTKTKFEYVNVDNKIKPLHVLKNLFKRTSYFVDRFDSNEYRKKLFDILKFQKFDVIQLEHIYLCLYLSDIRKHSKAKIILRAQNIENQLWKTYIKKLKNPIVKTFLSIAAKRLEHFEKHMINQVDGIMALSPNDAVYFTRNSNKPDIIDIPLGFDFKKLKNIDTNLQYKNFPALYHLGSMDWLPNIQGMKWFINKVMPLIREKHPNLRIFIAGKKMSKWFFRHQSTFFYVEGTVEDAVKYQENKAIMIVPLLTGSGIRVKILEGMAYGKTIISTTVGAQGLDVVDNSDILIADTPEAFLTQITKCIESETLCRRIGNNARKLAFDKYNINSIGQRMLNFYYLLLGNTNNT